MEVFRPKRSLGWLWSLGFALAIIASLLFIMVMVSLDPDSDMNWLAWAIVLAIDLPLFVLFATVAAFFPAMRYEFGADKLTLSYGPILHYRIPYTDVKAVRREELHVQLWSSMRWPGLALYKVPYSEIGPVLMCSTSVERDVVLIETPESLYGVSPAEEERFLDTLRARSGVSLS